MHLTAVCVLIILGVAHINKFADAKQLIGSGSSGDGHLRRGGVGVAAKGDLDVAVNQPIRLMVTGDEAELDNIQDHVDLGKALSKAVETVLADMPKPYSFTPGDKTYTFYKNVGVLMVDVDGSTSDDTIKEIIEALQESGVVDKVEADTTVRNAAHGNSVFTVEPSSPFGKGNSTDNLHRGASDEPDEVQWGLVNIGAFAAWELADLPPDLYRTRVALIGSGVHYSHEDIAMNAYVNEEELHGNEAEDDDDNGYIDDVFGWDPVTDSGYPLDAQGMGTMSAGVVGAVKNNDIGVVGVHPAPSLMPCKCLDEEGAGYLSNAIICIDYAIASEADVAVVDFGTYYESYTLKYALQKASAKDMTIVVPSGDNELNLSERKYYPCAMDVEGLLCVGAVDQSDSWSWHASYDFELVDLGAPGVNILSTLMNNKYAYSSGTALASAYVAGAAAFVKSTNPSLSNFNVTAILIDSAVPFNEWADKVQYGKLNLHAAVELALGYGKPTRPPGAATTTYTAAQEFTYEPTFHENSIPRAVQVMTDLTCEEGCRKYGGVCDEQTSIELNRSVETCYNFLSGQQSDVAFEKGGTVKVFDLPFGCQVNGSLEVMVNTHTQMIPEVGCRSAVARTQNNRRICPCYGM